MGSNEKGHLVNFTFLLWQYGFHAWYFLTTSFESLPVLVEARETSKAICDSIRSSCAWKFFDQLHNQTLLCEKSKKISELFVSFCSFTCIAANLSSFSHFFKTSVLDNGHHVKHQHDITNSTKNKVNII